MTALSITGNLGRAMSLSRSSCVLLLLLLVQTVTLAAATPGEASFMIWQVRDGTTGSCVGTPHYTKVNYSTGVESGCVNGTAYGSAFTSMQLQCASTSQSSNWNMTLYGDSAICTGGSSTLVTIVHSGTGCVNLQQYNGYFSGKCKQQQSTRCSTDTSTVLTELADCPLCFWCATGFVAIDCSGKLVDRSAAMHLGAHWLVHVALALVLLQLMT